mgnify:CR=1 FL=1
MKHFNLIARTNGVGLDQDVNLVKGALEGLGHQVSVSHCRARKSWQNWLPTKREFDANIFMERVFPAWIPTAKCNYLIPNQERFPQRHLGRLAKIDKVLCKTRHAEAIFAAHASTGFIGFTSPDRSQAEIEPDYSKFLHLAGKSTLKGTETILEVWSKHPEWPILTLIQHAENAPSDLPANIRLISDYLSDDELQTMLNQHGVHLCPSRSEGWGHYVVEAMSCRAVVLTTDAPPMNELVDDTRGILVPFSDQEPRHLGTNFFVDPPHLEQAIEKLIAMPSEEKEQLAAAGRSWFEDNNRGFAERLNLQLKLDASP